MEKYVIKYLESNGYTCSCCRDEYEDEIKFDSKDMMLNWLSKVDAGEFGKFIESYEIYKITQINENKWITETYYLTNEDNNVIKEKVNQIYEKNNKKIREFKEKTEKINKERRYERYLELKKEFEE